MYLQSQVYAQRVHGTQGQEPQGCGKERLEVWQSRYTPNCFYWEWHWARVSPRQRQDWWAPHWTAGSHLQQTASVRIWLWISSCQEVAGQSCRWRNQGSDVKASVIFPVTRLCWAKAPSLELLQCHHCTQGSLWVRQTQSPPPAPSGAALATCCVSEPQIPHLRNGHVIPTSQVEDWIEEKIWKSSVSYKVLSWC